MTSRSLIGVAVLLLGSSLGCSDGPTEPAEMFDISGEFDAGAGTRYSFVCEACPASGARFFGARTHPVSVAQALEGSFDGRRIEVVIGAAVLTGTIRSNDLIELGSSVLRRIG